MRCWIRSRFGTVGEGKRDAQKTSHLSRVQNTHRKTRYNQNEACGSLTTARLTRSRCANTGGAEANTAGFRSPPPPVTCRSLGPLLPAFALLLSGWQRRRETSARSEKRRLLETKSRLTALQPPHSEEVPESGGRSAFLLPIPTRVHEGARAHAICLPNHARTVAERRLHALLWFLFFFLSIWSATD